MSETLAYFQSSGVFPLIMDSWKILVGACVTVLAITFRNVVEIPASVAFLWLRSCMSLRTPFSVTLMSGAVGVLLLPRSGVSDISSEVRRTRTNDLSEWLSFVGPRVGSRRSVGESS